MRWSFLFVVLAAAACSEVRAPPRIFVSNVPSGVHVAREEGDVIKLSRWDMDPAPGLTRGYWIVRSEREWRDLWPTLEADKIPLLPHGYDFTRDMLIVAAPTEATAGDARIHQAIDTPEVGLHIYVSQIVPGIGCPATASKRDDRVPVDLAWIPLSSKEVHFHVDTKNEDPCSPPNEAKIGCRVDGTADEYMDKLSAEPGRTVSCLSQGKLGSRATIDRTWSFRSHPTGTTARMTIAEGGGGVTFTTDAFGTYSIGLDVTDDLGRVARATTDVNVLPPKDALVVQMLWTHFQPEDDPTTFPRVELHMVGEKAPPPPPPGKTIPVAARSVPWILVKGDCAIETEKPPPWCHTRVLAQTSIEEASTEAFPLYRIGVHYGDDRYAGQPVLCVRTFRGAQASEWCDDKVRQEGSWWDVGTVDAMTGKVPAPPAPPRPAVLAASAAPASSAAPSASAAPAGSATPATKAPPATPSASPSSSASAASKPPASPQAHAAPAPSSAPGPKPAGSAAPKSSPDPWTP
jgi:hypothetical protein